MVLSCNDGGRLSSKFIELRRNEGRGGGWARGSMMVASNTVQQSVSPGQENLLGGRKVRHGGISQRSLGDDGDILAG